MSESGVILDPTTGDIIASGNLSGASIDVSDLTQLRAGGKPFIEQQFTGAIDMVPTSDAVNTRLSSVLNGVNQLPALSDLTPKFIGTMYFLKESQFGYQPGHFYEVISGDSGLEYKDFANVKNIPLGVVTNIRFSFIDGVLNVYWRDPDDVFIAGGSVAKFGFTRLIAKIGSYPESPNDGQILIDSSVKNQYLETPATFNLDKNETWYCRFFPCTDTGIWSYETAYPTDNRFMTDSYSWDKIYSYLEEFNKYHLALPAEGDTFYLNYMINDYWTENGTTHAANTRQLVMDNLDKIASTQMPWRVLGYNANVPQYVKYRMKIQRDRGTSTTNPLTQVVTIGGTVISDAVKNDTCRYRETEEMQIEQFIFNGDRWVAFDAFSEYDYKWVSSADDKVEAIEFFDYNGSSLGKRDVVTGIEKEYGAGWQRSIEPGCRVYNMSYDAASGVKTYDDALSGSSKLSVIAINENTFTYDNNGVGKANAYAVPTALSIGIGNKVSAYTFCGYTMTVQPQHCLNGVAWTGSATAHYNNIQFDANESNSYATPYNFFPTAAKAGTGPDYGYYWKDNAGFHLINLADDGKGGTLFEANTQDFNGHEVWKKLPNGEIVMDTCVYQNNHKYVKKTGTTTYERQDVIIPFELNTVYYASNTNKNYDSSFNGGVVNDFVGRFDNNGNLTAIYKCIAQTAASQSLYPENDSAHFSLDTTILASGKYVVVGQKIPVNQNIYEVNIINRTNGCNLYEESFFKQYVNNINGVLDANYEAKNRWDVVSTSGLRNVNGPMLKLSKEQDFVKHIVPCVNITVLSPYNRQFRRAKSVSGSWVEHSIDLFWPLANYETFGSGVDGSCIFDKVLGTNEKRIKYYVGTNGAPTSTAYWWLRYPYTGFSLNEYIVTTSGGSYVIHAHFSVGCVPACILG